MNELIYLTSSTVITIILRHLLEVSFEPPKLTPFACGVVCGVACRMFSSAVCSARVRNLKFRKFTLSRADLAAYVDAARYL